MNDDAEKAKAIIERILYLTVATVSDDGKPWNSPVFSAFDENYNFYWGSHKDSQHSKNIRANSSAFLVIYDSTAEAGTGLGVYAEAIAHELEDPKEISLAHNFLRSRSSVPYWEIKELQGSAPVRLYKAVPQKFWINDEAQVSGSCIDTRTEIKL